MTLRTTALKLTSWAVLEKILMPENALAIETSLQTGLRISDVLKLTRADLLKGQRFTVSESKTRKRKRVYIGRALYLRLVLNAGTKWVFPSPKDPRKHRTRQAVWADVKRAAKALRLGGNVAPHSARKSFACGELARTRSLARVQRELNHASIETTVIYCLEALGGGLGGANGAPHFK